MAIILDGTNGITTPSGSTVRSTSYLDADSGNTATFNGIPLRQGVLDPENRIINGAFDFWQRGTSFTTTAYGADRWVNNFGSGTVTQSRQAFTLGDTLGSNNPTYFLRQVVSGQTTAASYATTYQRIEGVRSYAGQTITILGWARRSSGTGNMVVDAEQNFGTGGSPSTSIYPVPNSPTNVTLTTSWATFAVTMTIPSITGKTLGSNFNDFFQISFWMSAGSDYNARLNSLGLQTIGVDLWGIHIKVGTHTTDAVNLYKQPEIGTELARCQRYYEKSYALTTNPGTATATCKVMYTSSGSATLLYNSTPFVVRKRADPAVSFWDLAGNLSRLTSGATNNLAIAAGGLTMSQYNIQLDAGITGLGANSKLEFQFTADAEL